MDRRNFFRVVGTASGGAITGACGRKSEEIIPLLVPEEGITPGVESWHPAVCGECAAGCGILARVMASEREIEVDGERVRQRIATVKKLEGNPNDPTSGGRLCARGHAGLQALYGPDRLRGPMRRAGPRGAGRFEAVSWESAMQEAAEALDSAVAEDAGRVVFLSRPRADLRAANIAKFLSALGAPPACAVGVRDFAAEVQGAERAYGWRGIPAYAIRDATLVLSIGADFLSGWVSPVLYTRQFGHMRRGRPGVRGRLIHAESRFSLTAWNADRWLPVWPGGELALALGLGRALVDLGVGASPTRAVEAARAAFAEVDLDEASAACGISAGTIREVATELAAASEPVVVAGASIVREHSADAVAAASALNVLLGRVGVAGGVMPPPTVLADLVEARPSSNRWRERLANANLVIIDGANPAYSSPSCREALANAGTVISLSSFVDDTSAYADVVLPDHDPLEREAVALPSASLVESVACSSRFVAALHDSRPAVSVLADLAASAGKPFEPLDAQGALTRLHATLGAGNGAGSSEGFVESALEQGCWQGRPASGGTTGEIGLGAFEVNDSMVPAVFQAYESLQFGTGGGANRPWLQELPDPTSSAMWGLPLEIDPVTASELAIENGDIVRARSDHGSLEAPAYVNPAAIPGVISMAMGQGHSQYGRYASGRGANPMSLLGDMRDRRTGATAMGPVRVHLERLDKGKGLIQFSRQDRDVPPHRV